MAEKDKFQPANCNVQKRLGMTSPSPCPGARPQRQVYFTALFFFFASLPSFARNDYWTYAAYNPISRDWNTAYGMVGIRTCIQSHQGHTRWVFGNPGEGRAPEHASRKITGGVSGNQAERSLRSM